MSKFNFAPLQVDGTKTARYELYQLAVNGKTPTLIVKPATEANPPYFNALLKRSSKNARAIQAGAVTQAMLAENRSEDRELYPEHIVTDWENVVDSAGKPVPFSKADAADFIKALPDWIVDDLRTYCGNPRSFVDSDAGGTAKN